MLTGIPNGARPHRWRYASAIAKYVDRFRRVVPSSIRRAATAGYNRAVSTGSTLAHPDYPVDRTSIVLGTGRSGTTFLQQLISASPTTYPIFEPLSPSRDPLVAAMGTTDGFVIQDPADQNDVLRGLLEQILLGRRLNRWSTRLRRTTGLFTADRFVVKEVRLTRAIGWLGRQFPNNRIVVIVRHPCAVVTSMMNARGSWRQWSADHVARLLRGGYETQADSLLRPHQPQVERLAAFWAAETSDVLSQTTPDTVLLVAYEELVLDATTVLDRVFAYLGMTPPAELDAAIVRPSAMSTPQSAIRSGTDSLTSWQARLSEQDRDRVIETVAAFGIHAYDSAPLPDLAALHGQHASTRVD